MSPDLQHLQSEISRRRILQYGAVALGGMGLLAACGGGSTSTTSTGSGTPVLGGTFNVGMITNGAAETLNPGAGTAYPDNLRAYQLYDLLFTVGANLEIEPMLATSAEPDASRTLWTFRLRDGVTWHDGSPSRQTMWCTRSGHGPRRRISLTQWPAR